MGERNRRTKAIIISIRIQGESNRTITALSPDDGIFYATLYGGPKSRMRSLVQQFNSGTIYVYEDVQKHTKKISDFDVETFHPTLHTSLYKMWAANFAAELVLKTKCAGDSKGAYTLLSAFIDGIDLCDDDGARLGMIRFLWRYLHLLGVQPDVHTCCGCGEDLLPESRKNAGAGLFVYIPSMSGIACPECVSSFSNAENREFFALDESGLSYLAAINELKPGAVRTMRLAQDSIFRLKNFLYHLIENAVGARLLSLESGAGIL